jgi:hypothetical protein
MGGMGGAGKNDMDKMGGMGGTRSDDQLGLGLGRGGGHTVPEQDQLSATGGLSPAQAELGHDTMNMGIGSQQDSIPSELDLQEAGQDMLQSDALPGTDAPVNLTKRDLNEEPAKILSVKLKNGILKDALHRTGYISGGDPQLQ